MINPVRDIVVLLPVEDATVTPGGIIIPETADKDAPRKFTVQAVGPKVSLVKPGDTVMVSKYNGTTVKIDGVDHKLVEEEYILAILEG